MASMPENRGASSHERCLRSLGVNALNPELDVAVLARDPADPRIEAPASEQPHRDTACLRDGYDLADNTQLSLGPLVHGLILPRPSDFGIPERRRQWLPTAREQPTKIPKVMPGDGASVPARINVMTPYATVAAPATGTATPGIRD